MSLSRPNSPSLTARYLALVAMVLGLLAPVVSVALGQGDPLTGVCRAPDSGTSKRAPAHGWFEHCSACGSLSQSLGGNPAPAALPHLAALSQVQSATLPTDAARPSLCGLPPARAPPPSR
ncbi:hypothetical protein HNQ51_001841 [Inhella inkyongensis]|uniref:DUF2946 domain-containing protein n=1 Tax=Inhella inkyongensis TaxID=392593 RepID=A0A840S0D1_9BURK|nr:DUF2946 family protein [Inhella inkyongensis]MBB5204527.1 hypothetical protein [Inhella inkyongensis]